MQSVDSRISGKYPSKLSSTKSAAVTELASKYKQLSKAEQAQLAGLFMRERD